MLAMPLEDARVAGAPLQVGLYYVWTQIVAVMFKPVWRTGQVLEDSKQSYNGAFGLETPTSPTRPYLYRLKQAFDACHELTNTWLRELICYYLCPLLLLRFTKYRYLGDC